MHHLLLLGGAGLLAGTMNALAGGGSFVSLPALIAAGVPSVQANTSSTVALFPGGLTSAWAYRSGNASVGPVTTRTLLVATLLGGVVGASLLLKTPSKAFDFVLPWLLLIAFLALGFGRKIGAFMRERWTVRPSVVVVVQFLLGIYGGYFGGAVGIMMLAMWGLLDNRDIKSLHAPRTLMVSAANAMAVLVFILSHSVQWAETAVMLVAAALGGYVGALLGRRLPAQTVRVGTLLLTGAMTVAFFARAYRSAF
jgi:uncharacterized membrane protein YfcA